MPTTPAAVATPLEISATSGASVSFGVGAPPPPPPPAPTITLSSDGAAVAGTAEAITVTAANLTGPLTVTMESVSGPGVSWSPTTVAPAPGELVKLSMATWAAAGTAQVRGTAPGGIVSNTLTVAVSPAPSPSPPPGPPPPPASPLDIAPLQITSTEVGSLPWTVGHAFKKGDVPAGSTVGGSGVALQVEPRNTWPDGSLRFAVISGLTAASTVTLRRSGTQASGSNVAEPSIAAVVTLTNVRDHAAAVLHATLTASLADARAAGATAWNRTTPRRVRQSLGPVMSEFHYYAPTADAHLAVWWHVRAYSDGRAEVTTIIENGWLQVAAPGERVYNVDVSVGGTSRYAATDISHKHHTRWSRLDWIGGDPAVTPIHDTRYLQRTRMVPGLGIRSVGASVYDPYAATREQAERGTPFDLSNVNPGLGGGGHSDNYGILPGWECAHLISGEPRMYWAAMRNARYAAGRFHVHYRDEATGAPARGSVHFSLRINSTNGGINDLAGGSPSTPVPAGGLNTPNWYFSHGPALGYGAYLLSGRYEFAEAVAFYSTAADLWQSDANQYEGYRIAWWGLQLRQRAHIFRLRAQHALIAPRTFGGSTVAGEDAAQLTEAEGRLNAEINYYRQIYVAGGNNTEPRLVAHRDNALGVWAAGDADGTTDGRYQVPGLQQALNIVPTLWAYDAESSTNVNFQPLIEFTARWPLGLFGTMPTGQNWDWRLMSAYTLNAGVDNADPVLWTLDASWNALWTRLTTTYSWEVMGGGSAATNPASLAPDKLLRTFQTRDGSNVAWIEPITQLDNLTDNFTATFHNCAAIGLLHQIALSGRLSSLTSQCQWAAGRLYESDTFRNSMAAGSYLRTNITYAQWGVKSVAYENLDDASALIDVLAGARAAVGGSEWTWVKANTNTITSVFPPVGLRDPFSGGDGILQMVSAWGGHVWDMSTQSLRLDGTGHSAAGCTERFQWDARTLQWALSYYGAEQIACPAPYYRARDFNGTPPSAHPYDNQCFGKVRQRVYQAYAGTFNSGNRGRVWRPGEPGTQSNGTDGQPGANYTGIFEIDMSQAGQGKCLGAAGTNAASGINAGTSLPGANAALLHDWYGTGGPAPFFEGATQALTIESSMAYTDEVPGKDAFYWTAGNKWLILTTISSSNPADDTHQLVCRDGSVYGAGRGSVQISLDPVRRVVLAVTNDADTNPGCIKFADLKRTWGVSNGWRDATLTGPDIAEFLALNRIDMGCKFDPVSGKHLLYNGVGRQVWAITTPTGNPTPDTGWVLEKLPMNAAVAAPPVSADTFQTVGQAPGADFIIGINGNWQHHNTVRAHCAVLGRGGDVWYLVGPAWTNPRND